MSEREQLVAALRKSDFAGYRTGEAADIIEQQAKELAGAQARIELLEHDMKSGDFESLYANTVFELQEAQARVVVLMDFVRLVSTHFVDPAGFTPELLQDDKFEEFLACAEKVDLEIKTRCKELLASTDTAAQTLLPKYVEPTSCGRCDYDEAEGGLIEQCPKCKAIDAAKEKL